MVRVNRVDTGNTIIQPKNKSVLNCTVLFGRLPMICAEA